jgi:hypothetical protein
MQLKYIRTKSGFTIWPEETTIWHKHMAALVKEEVLSAGFCIFTGGAFHCYGLSESLQIKSRGVEDSIALNKFFGVSYEF